MSWSVEVRALLEVPKKSLSYWNLVRKQTHLSSIAMVSPESR